MPIYNCHMHIFTIEHVPNQFLPLRITRLMRNPFLRLPLRFLLANMNPFSNRDLFHRYSNFVRVSYKKSQKDVFKLVRSYYPLDTKFIVLPMDMEFMGAGKVEKDIYEQHKELAELRDQYPEQIIPFAAIDPRRNDVVKMLAALVEKDRFKGVKLYPPLGYRLDNEKLYEVYEYSQRNNIPIMVHCSRGGIKHKDISTNLANSYADPDNCKRILKEFPNLRFCLGHFGGDKEWKKYLNDPWDESSPDESKSWLSKILDLMKSGNYPNLYADISYTIFSFEKNSKLLKVLLEDPKVRSQVLFGSDFYMVEQEKFQERRLSIELRAVIGEKFFKEIAEINPKKYLGTSSSP